LGSYFSRDRQKQDLDWANSHQETVIFLKDSPMWYEDSEKEIPIKCKALIIDDAHRQETFGKVLQLLQETAGHCA